MTDKKMRGKQLDNFLIRNWVKYPPTTEQIIKKTGWSRDIIYRRINQLKAKGHTFPNRLGLFNKTRALN